MKRSMIRHCRPSEIGNCSHRESQEYGPARWARTLQRHIFVDRDRLMVSTNAPNDNGLSNFARQRAAVELLLLLLLALISYWIFVDIYRTNAFGLSPRDDYAPYLLYMIGDEGGRVPGSPFAYRALSVALAVPFYYVLPFFEFSLLTGKDEVYLKATEALAMLNYVSMVLTSALVYLITCRRLRGSMLTGSLAALSSLLMLQFHAATGVDTTGIMVVALLVYYLDSRIAFSAIVLMAAVINEKILVVIGALLMSRVVLAKQYELLAQAVASVLAVALYLAIRAYFQIPGHEHQLDFASMLGNLPSSLANLFSLRQLILTIVPTLAVLTFYTLAMREWVADKERAYPYFSAYDLSAFLVLFLLSMGIGIQVFGRIVLYCLPFYLPFALVRLERYIYDLERSSC